MPDSIGKEPTMCSDMLGALQLTVSIASINKDTDKSAKFSAKCIMPLFRSRNDYSCGDIGMKVKISNSMETKLPSSRLSEESSSKMKMRIRIRRTI